MNSQPAVPAAEAMLSAAGQLADSLADPPPPATGGGRGPDSPRWRAQSLSRGAAGIAILHGARARSGTGGWDRARDWLEAAASDELSAGPGSGLWYGAAVVAFAVAVAAPPGAAPTARRQLSAAVRALTQARLEAARSRMNARQRPQLAEFDLAKGLTGLGAYLLGQEPDPGLLRQVLSYLVQLTEPVHAGDQAGPDAPGWWTSDTPPGLTGQAFTGGYADLGMAHGISGCLALMALAMRRGVTIPGQAEAIDRICGWLGTWRQDGPSGPWWPARVTLPMLRGETAPPPGPARPSWCYGTPGITRALQLAALALDHRVLQLAAEQAFAASLADSVQAALITDQGPCHGHAGMTLAAWRAAQDAASLSISRHIPRLTSALAASPGAAAGPGLIEGTAGTALTLHAIATQAPPGGWENCLLIS